MSAAGTDQAGDAGVEGSLPIEEGNAASVPLSSPVNLRDLGGIPVAGGVLREGFAIRADDLAIVTEVDARSLVSGGLRSVIDLRSAEESAVTGRGPLAAHPVHYHHLPFHASMAEAMDDHDGFGSTHESFGEHYARMYETAAPQIVTALSIMALSPGATAFHCAAGKDRTGVLAAAMLTTLGASDEEIVADYARTEANIDAIHLRTRPVIGPLMTRLGVDLDAMAASAVGMGFSDVAMRTMLARLRERHGDPLVPLRAAGLSDGLVSRLRERAVA